jgi:hypothetical protein
MDQGRVNHRNVTGENSIAFGVKREPGEILKTLPISIRIVFGPLYGAEVLETESGVGR